MKRSALVLVAISLLIGSSALGFNLKKATDSLKTGVSNTSSTVPSTPSVAGGSMTIKDLDRKVADFNERWAKEHWGQSLQSFATAFDRDLGVKATFTSANKVEWLLKASDYCYYACYKSSDASNGFENLSTRGDCSNPSFSHLTAQSVR